MASESAAAMASRLARMIQVPTVSAELDQRGAAPFEEFLSLLHRLYPLTAERLEHERVTEFGLLSRWPGADPEAAPLVLMAHYDVVPAEESEGWDHPPFAGHVDDIWVHGRGALDDKGPLLVIAEAVESLLAEGFTPARDVYLSFGGNEEVQGDAAAQIAELLASRGVTPWLVLDEGGAVVDSPIALAPGQAAMIGIGEKGVATLRLRAISQGGHASAPEGPTAAARIGRALHRLDASTFPARAPEAVTQMLATLAQRGSGASGRLLRLMASSPALAGRVLARLGPEPAALVRTTIAATRISGGTADNVLPPSAEAVLNLRLHPEDSVETALQRVGRRIADDQVQVELIEGSEPTAQSPVDGPQFQALAEAVRASYPQALPTPYLMMQASDSRHFHRFSPAVYRFAPLEMSADQRAGIHGVNERVSIDSLVAGCSFHRHLIRGLG